VAVEGRAHPSSAWMALRSLAVGLAARARHLFFFL
jgi:hypothetical protein